METRKILRQKIEEMNSKHEGTFEIIKSGIGNGSIQLRNIETNRINSFCTLNFLKKEKIMLSCEIDEKSDMCLEYRNTYYYLVD